MSRLHEVLEKWEKAPPYEGVRVAQWSDFIGLDDLDWLNIEDILNALEWQELITFEYKGRDRLVAPFVFGVSSEGNALMRGYQLEGSSRSGKGAGWRVYQVRELSMLDLYGEWFEAEDFDFDRKYPWIYKVFKML
uniref:WYL domain-containing protein n=1 Tax=candidate division WOR-3 bacterium TaxID=2052148 RepID=A0A7V3KN03_UNCW3